MHLHLYLSNIVNKPEKNSGLNFFQACLQVPERIISSLYIPISTVRI